MHSSIVQCRAKAIAILDSTVCLFFHVILKLKMVTSAFLVLALHRESEAKLSRKGKKILPSGLTWKQTRAWAHVRILRCLGSYVQNNIQVAGRHILPLPSTKRMPLLVLNESWHLILLRSPGLNTHPADFPCRMLHAQCATPSKVSNGYLPHTFPGQVIFSFVPCVLLFAFPHNLEVEGARIVYVYIHININIIYIINMTYTVTVHNFWPGAIL